LRLRREKNEKGDGEEIGKGAVVGFEGDLKILNMFGVRCVIRLL